MNPSGKRWELLIAVALGLAILAVYWPVVHQDFVNYDDDYFLTKNPHVAKGIAWESVVWAFRDTSHGWWHPLTWLSHMLDWQLFGPKAGAHKLVNVTFHVGSTLVLFLVLNRMTTAPWRSAFVAAAFALHPLRVESVAWVSERKDVLSTFFWILTMWAYVRYVERQLARRYLLALVCFSLGLMAKSMLVTLPCVLLLLDFWPLGRTRWARSVVGERTPTGIKRLVWEKLPFLVLSGISSVIAYWAQSTIPAGSAVKSLPLVLRAGNATVSYVRYIGKTLWPVNLSVFYPHPGAWRPSAVAFAALVIVLLTMLVIRVARARPYLTVGWLWYLGTLVPTIGLIQVGDQSIADRYTYIPSIGLFIMVAWGASGLVCGWRQAETAMRAAALTVIVAWMAITRHQLQYWANSITLFEHAIAVTRGNYIAQNNLGTALGNRGSLEPAAAHFQEAVNIWPQFPEANKNLADILLQFDRVDDAVRHYRQALQKKPNWPEAHNDLGSALVRQGQMEEAFQHFERAVELDPTLAVAQGNLALALMKSGRLDDAVVHAACAVDLDPKDPQGQYLLGLMLKEQGRREEAVRHFEEALRWNPNYAAARVELDKLHQ